MKWLHGFNEIVSLIWTEEKEEWWEEIIDDMLGIYDRPPIMILTMSVPVWRQFAKEHPELIERRKR